MVVVRSFTLMMLIKIYNWIKKKLLWVFVGGVVLAAGVTAIPPSVDSQLIIDNIQNEIQIGQKVIDIHFTDENVGEELIIKSDEENFSGFLGGIAGITAYVSVTNASAQNQNVSLAFSFEDDRFLVEDIKRFLRNEDVVLPGHTIPATATSSEIVMLDTTIEVPIWVNLPFSNFQAKTHVRKDIKQHITDKEVFIQIKSGETIRLKVIIRIPPGIYESNKSQFFIEAFGDKGSYGHI